MELIEYQMIHRITGPLWVSIHIQSLIQKYSIYRFELTFFSSRRRWSDCCDGNEIQEFWEINACRTHGRTEVKLQLRQSIHSCVKTYKDMSRLTRSDLMIFNVYVFALGPFKGGDIFIKIRRTSFHPNSQAEPCLMQEVKCKSSQKFSLVMFSHIAFHYMNTRRVILNHFYWSAPIKHFTLISCCIITVSNTCLVTLTGANVAKHWELIILLVCLLFSASSWFCVFCSSKSPWTDHTGTCLTTSTGRCSFHSIITVYHHIVSHSK